MIREAPSGHADVSAACVQMRVGSDKAENLRTATHWVQTAAAQGAALVVLPEMFFWRGAQEAFSAAAEPLSGPTVSFLSDLARKERLTLVAGSILETDLEGGGLPFNTTVVFGPDGSELGTYRKVHLFDVAIPSGPQEKESERMQPGHEAICVKTPVGRLGLTICYDLRFPELYRDLVQQGAEILVVPAAFTAHTGRAHWEVLLRARAIENQCWLLAAAQTGPVATGPEVFGHSAIVDPWGEIIAAQSSAEGLVVGDLCWDRLEEVRRELPALTHMRWKK